MKMMMIAHCETANDNDERFVILFFRGNIIFPTD